MIVLSRLCGNVSVCARAFACLAASSPFARQHWMLSAARSFFFKSTCRHLLHGDGLLLSNFPLVMITHKKKKVEKNPGHVPGLETQRESLGNLLSVTLSLLSLPFLISSLCSLNLSINFSLRSHHLSYCFHRRLFSNDFRHRSRVM